ncbi:MAG: energy transducer TonB [Rhodanobacter sp.]|jgi:protein TonB
MSSISLPSVRHAHPEPARIAALSAAMGLNLAVLLIATRPLPVSLPTLPVHAPTARVRLIPPPPQPLAPPPVELQPLPHVQPTPHVAPHPVTVGAPPLPVADGQAPAPAAEAPPAPAQDRGVPALPAAPVEASLAYVANPIAYPVNALRQHLQGTVVLRVLVDETGQPLEVTVVRGSGHAELDRSARAQVLAHWRFQPAIVNGHAVRAWASVPVTFTLRG